MTIKKLIKRYSELVGFGYETITIHEVLRDLKGCQRIRKPKADQNKRPEWEGECGRNVIYLSNKK